MSRTTPAHLQRPINFTTGELRLFYMGANATRFEMVKDPVSGLWLPGVRLEGARTNSALQSRAMGTTWTQVALTSITANGQAGIDGSSYMDGLVGTAVDTQHGLTQAVTMTAAEWCIGGVFQVGNKTWVKLFDTTLSAHKYFDIGNAVKGAAEANVNASWARRLTTNLVEAWIRVTGTVAAHTVGFNVADANNDDSVLGDASTVNLWAGNLQVEAGLYPSSIIPTTTGTVERTADSALIYESGLVDGTYQTTVLLPVLLPEHAPAADTAIFKIYDAAGAATDHLTLSAKATTGVLRVTSAASGGSAGDVEGTVNIADGNLHWIAASIKPGQLACWTDSAPGTVDSAVDVSDVLDSCAYQPCGGWMGGVHVWPKFMNRSPRPVQPLLVST